MAGIPTGVVSTLDEPVCTTIFRDLKAIGRKIAVVAIPPLGHDNELRDWDLWGPLLLCICLAMLLGNHANSEQHALVFSGVFMLVWIGSAIITLNAKLLGGKLSFFQIVCLVGYCLSPMLLFAFIVTFIHTSWLKVLLNLVGLVWSVAACLRFFRGCVKPEREILVMYPVFLFYFFLFWLLLVGL